MGLFEPLADDARRALDAAAALADKTFPLPGRFRARLPSDVAELSRLLTSGRGERGLSYLGRPSLLSAYLRFYLPWNLYRLCRLLPGLDIDLRPGDVITDLGCGPFTFAAALWISRPELRSVELEFNCIDRSAPALEAGGKFLAALCGSGGPWKARALRGELGAVRAKPAALVCAANVFNEMHGDVSRGGHDALALAAAKSARLLEGYASGAPGSAVLVVEPVFPRCGEFVALLRGELIARGRMPDSPCPHALSCPMPGDRGSGGARAKGRWCHFAFGTEGAPASLLKLSAAARIPKERAVLSFAFAKKREARAPEKPAGEGCALRVVSDAFALPGGRFGRYCCCERGLVLLAGDQGEIESAGSGALVDAVFSGGRKDAKSGAPVAELAGKGGMGRGENARRAAARRKALSR